MRIDDSKIISFDVRQSNNNSSQQLQIWIDPFSFFVGGIGAVGVGSVADEYRRNGSEDEFSNSALRSLMTPIKSAIRFFLGGFVYILSNTIILKVSGYRVPFVAGAITAICTAGGSRARVFLGCTLGMALFCQIVEMAHTKYH